MISGNVVLQRNGLLLSNSKSEEQGIGVEKRIGGIMNFTRLSIQQFQSVKTGREGAGKERERK